MKGTDDKPMEEPCCEDDDNNIIFTENVIKEIRNKYNIGKEYIPYLFNNNNVDIRNELMKLSKKIKIEFNSSCYTSHKIENVSYGLYQLDDNYIVTYKILHRGSSWIIFSKDIEKLSNKYLKNTKSIMEGIFTIKSSCFGTYLEKNVMADGVLPILNDNLTEKLMKEIKTFRKSEKLYNSYNFDYKRGILLYGEPGCGKTTFIKHVIKNLKALTILCSVKSYEHVVFLEDFFGKNSFDDYLKIIVMEDIDGMDNGIRSRVLNMLDGVFNVRKTIFLATTNFPHQLDKALINRPSRLDSLYHIESPNEKSRRCFLNLYFKGLSKKTMDEALVETKTFRGCHFKEILLISKFNKCSVLDAITEFKEKFDTLNKFNNQNYMG